MLHEQWRSIGDARARPHGRARLSTTRGGSRSDACWRDSTRPSTPPPTRSPRRASTSWPAATSTAARGPLDEIANGQAPPPQLEFMRTPRTGTPITHRVALVVAAADRDADPASGWADGSRSPRAAAEPRAERLGGADCSDRRPASTSGSPCSATGGDVVSEHARAAARSWRCRALDLVWISGDAGAASELAATCVRRRRCRRSDAAPPPFLRLDLSPATDRDRRSLADLLELASALRAGCSPAPGRSTVPTCSPPTPTRTGAPTSTSSRRGSSPRSGRSRPGGRPSTSSSTSRTRRSVRYRRALAAIAGFGVSAGVNPLAGRDDDPAPAGSAVAAVATRGPRRRRPPARRRRTRGDGSRRRARAGRRDRLLRRLQAVFGPGFVARPGVHAPRPRADLDAARSLARVAGGRSAGGVHVGHPDGAGPPGPRPDDDGLPPRRGARHAVRRWTSSVAQVPHAGDRSLGRAHADAMAPAQRRLSHPSSSRAPPTSTSPVRSPGCWSTSGPRSCRAGTRPPGSPSATTRPTPWRPRRCCSPCRRRRPSRGPSARSTRCCWRRSTSPICAPSGPRPSAPSGTTCRRRCWRSTSTATPCPPIPTPSSPG